MASRPSMYPGAGASAGSGASSAGSIAEQMSQIDQAITLTLQEIDENFAKSHQVITNRILPAIKHYGESSYRISHATRFWRYFFETAAQISLDFGGAGDELEAGSGAAGTSTDLLDLEDTTTTDERRRSGGGGVGGGKGDTTDDSLLLADDSLYQSMRPTSSPARSAAAGQRASAGASRTSAGAGEPRWAEMESPFERAQRELKGSSASARPHQLHQLQQQLRNPADESSSDIATPPQISRPARSRLLQQQQGGTPKRAGENPFGSSGIADLRRTPLSVGTAGGKPDNSVGSYVPGHSPPVTMQFSMPRSKYLQTPAKEAARMVVDDLLRTAGGGTPGAAAALRRKQQQQQLQQRGGGSVLGTPLKEAALPTPPTLTKTLGGGRSPATGGSKASMLMDKGEDEDESDSDSDSSDADSDEAGFAPPIPMRDASVSGVGSSFSAAAQSIKDDTLFGSKIGSNPFGLGSGLGSASTTTTTTGGSGGAPSMPSFEPLGNIKDMGTVYDGRPLGDHSKTNTWSAESPSK